MSALNGELNPNFHDFSRVRIGMLSVVSVCLPGPNVSPNSPRYTNCTCCDSRTISCAPFLIALSSSGNRYDNVSRESSVHSMISISSPLMKSIRPIARSTEGRRHAGGESSILWVIEAPDDRRPRIALPELRGRRRPPRATLLVLPRPARDHQLSELFCADVRRIRILPHLRRALGESRPARFVDPLSRLP